MPKFLTGLFLGLGLGVIIGLLIAPQSGEATRAQLGEQGIRLRTGDLTDDIRSRANEAMTQGRELYQRTKNELATRYKDTITGER